jgi:predicted TIM-barrel fold metal-dependent hydrolase
MPSKISRTALALFAIFAFWMAANALLAQQQPSSDAKPVAALSPFIDVHVHMNRGDAEKSVQAAADALRKENAARIIFMPSPWTAEDKDRFDIEYFEAAVKKYAGKLAFLGGGATLDILIQQSLRSGDSGPEVQRKFRESAEDILRQGAIGFGEVTAEHLPSAASPSHQAMPPDHPLFLLLADIAAQHDVPIDMHMEAIPQTMPLPSNLKSPPNPPQLEGNIAAFERLLAHNPRARIVWAHAGTTDNTGYRTPELCRRLLEAHPNLYMEIKVDPLNPGKNPPLADGKIKPDWLKLFEDFPDRFVIGSDQFYPEAGSGLERWQAVVQLFNQLPVDLRRKIGTENAQRIYFSKRETSEASSASSR